MEISYLVKNKRMANFVTYRPLFTNCPTRTIHTIPKIIKRHVANVVLLLVCISSCPAKPQATAIPETEITTLRQEIEGFDTRASEVKKRRACKNIIRRGNALVDAKPTAPNRYRVLAIVFQTQIRLLALDNSDRNREALFETCATLAKAPDVYAKLRLQADFLLMERDMSSKKESSY